MAIVNVEEDLYVFMIYGNFAYLCASDVGPDLPHLLLLFSFIHSLRFLLLLLLRCYCDSSKTSLSDGVPAIRCHSTPAPLVHFSSRNTGFLILTVFVCIPLQHLSSTSLGLRLVFSSSIFG